MWVTRPSPIRELGRRTSAMRSGTAGRLVVGEHLAGVEAAGRVQRALEGAHDLDGLAALLAERAALAEADAVLARAGAAGRDRPRDHPLVDGLRRRPVGRLVGVDEQHHV